MPPEQLPLPFPQHQRMRRADYHVGDCNRAAFHLVTHVADWPKPVAAIVGPDGAGKSHLGQIFADETGATVISMADVRLETLGPLMTTPLVIEGGITPPDEEALFHLFNRSEPTLMLSATPPAGWPVALADLRSRLMAMTVAEVTPPSDDVLKPVLLKLFHDRHATPDSDMIAYLTTRMDRSFQAARQLADRLTVRALSENRPLNRALAREVLEQTTADLPF